MEERVAGAEHVQENGPVRVEPKREHFARLDSLFGPDVVPASSTSGIPASAFTGGLAGRARCLVTHPVNPPYLVPLVELVGAPWTAPEVVAQTHALMARVGQVPVTAMKETRGFVLNRLQAALVAETFRLARVTAERRAVLPLEKIGERSALRHRRLMRVLGHKRKAKE